MKSKVVEGMEYTLTETEVTIERDGETFSCSIAILPQFMHTFTNEVQEEIIKNVHIKACEECGRGYRGTGRTRFCCTGCLEANEKRKNQLKYKERKKARYPDKICPYCGKTFTPNRTNQATCGSKKCSWKLQDEKKKKKPKPIDGIVAKNAEAKENNQSYGKAQAEKYAKIYAKVEI